MRSFVRIVLFTAALSVPAFAKGSASATASISIQADVQASGQTDAATGDAAYAKGEFAAALEAYGEGFAKTRDAAFLYAMAECHKSLGHADEAKSMFQMYLSAQGSASLKYEADARTELGMKSEGAVDAVKGLAKKTTDAVAKVEAGVWSAVKISISGSVKASAKAEAKAGDEAYAAGKYEDAASSYAQAYAKSQQAIALYAAAQANAQAGHGIEARGQLEGYLASKPKKFSKDAKTLLLAVGGSAKEVVKVSVKAKVSATAKADAGKGDKAMKAGQYLSAAASYDAAYTKSQTDAALLYAKGMAQYYAGLTADAATSLKAYLASSGTLTFSAQAQATLQATGSAS